MKSNAIAIYSGSGIGLLIGVLMGLAVSPTVGVIIGALASILAVLLGLNDTQFSNAKAVRIGSFGFACVLGAFLGIFVRTHNLLSPSPQALLQTYTKLGFSEPEVRDFIAYKEFGILDEKWKMADTQIVTTTGADGDKKSSGETKITGSLARSSHASVLFSADVNLSSCHSLEDMETLPPTEIVSNFKMEEGAWSMMASLAEADLKAEDAKLFLVAMRNGLCGQSDGKIDDSSCDALRSYPRDVEYSAIRKGFSASPGVWQPLLASIEGTKIEEQDMASALWIAKTALCKPVDNGKGEKS